MRGIYGVGIVEEWMGSPLSRISAVSSKGNVPSACSSNADGINCDVPL